MSSIAPVWYEICLRISQMNRVRFRYQDLLFLYAYLTQIDLSLDRCLWATGLICTYYRGQILPREVADYLLSISKLDRPPVQGVYFIRSRRLIDRICDFLLRIIFGRCFLKADEVSYCCLKLLALADLLEDRSSRTPTSGNRKLRLEFSRLTSGIIQNS